MNKIFIDPLISSIRKFYTSRLKSTPACLQARLCVCLFGTIVRRGLFEVGFTELNIIQYSRISGTSLTLDNIELWSRVTA